MIEDPLTDVLLDAAGGTSASAADHGADPKPVDPRAVVPRAPRRMVFSLLHAGYLRHYGEPIRILAERGHSIHLVLVRPEKDAGDRRLLEELVAETPNVTWEVAPGRGYVDGWRRIAWFVRAFADLSRYVHPRYADAYALRGRVAEKIELRVRAHRLDPVSRHLALRLVARMERSTDSELSVRWVDRYRRLEAALPPSRRVIRFLKCRRPDAVLVTPLVEVASIQTEYLKAAQRLGIRTGVAIASWDNLTNKGLIRIAPDRVIVWNEPQRREAAELHGISPDTVVVTGAQRWDKWFGRGPSTTRDEFAAKVGLDPAAPYVLYLCSSTFIAPDETAFVRRWIAAIRSAPDDRIRALGVLVRPHPQNAKQWTGSRLSSEFENAVVWPPAGAHPDAGDARDGFYDSLAHSQAVVGINTSAMVESAILGKSVFTLLDPEFAGTQEGTLHFRYLDAENGGFVRVAGSLDEHVAQLRGVLGDRSEDEARTRRFIAGFARPRGLDRPVAPLVADAVEELALLGPAERRRPSPRDFGLRLALAPLAAVLTAGASGTWLARALKSRFSALSGPRARRLLPATTDERARQLERSRRWV